MGLPIGRSPVADVGIQIVQTGLVLGNNHEPLVGVHDVVVERERNEPAANSIPQKKIEFSASRPGPVFPAPTTAGTIRSKNEAGCSQKGPSGTRRGIEG